MSGLLKNRPSVAASSETTSRGNLSDHPAPNVRLPYAWR